MSRRLEKGRCKPKAIIAAEAAEAMATASTVPSEDSITKEQTSSSLFSSSSSCVVKIDAHPPQVTIVKIPQMNNVIASTTNVATAAHFWKNAVANPFITKMCKIFDADVNDMNLESNDDSKDECSTSKLKEEEQESLDVEIASPSNLH